MIQSLHKKFIFILSFTCLLGNLSVTIANAQKIKYKNDEFNYAQYYIVVSDTGSEYFALLKDMFEIHQATGIPIDSMERTWLADKKIIGLPYDSEDEMFAGDYFPRRTTGEFLSLEYLNFYLSPTPEGNSMALVAGVFEKRKEAVDLKKRLRKLSPGCFFRRSEVYIGCMH